MSIHKIEVGNATLYCADCLEVLRGMPDNSVDSIVTDPPYHLTSNARGSHTGDPETPHGRARIGDRGFMGKEWDGGDIAQRTELWMESLRVLKPGGHLLAFSGSRTYHRMAVAIEDAGFEIRDRVLYLRSDGEVEEHFPVWVYGSGFPKNLDVSKAIDQKYDELTSHSRGPRVPPETPAGLRWKGWGTALKPAHEPICVARKPLVGTIVENVLRYGTGAINIDGCRVEGRERTDYGFANTPRTSSNVYGRPSETADFDSTKGRWPANLIHDGSEEVLASFPESSVTGKRTDTSKRAVVEKTTWGTNDHQSTEYTDRGSAARFFYCAKASPADRHEGLQNPGPQFKRGSTLRDAENLGAERGGNHHPTVKPTDLMRYLIRLVTPPGGTTLDMFMGSGSSGKAAALEGFHFIGIERDPEYFDISVSRIGYAQYKDQWETHRLNLTALSLEPAKSTRQSKATTEPVNGELF